MAKYLLVEGKLDFEILTYLLAGGPKAGPTVELGGSKDSLGPQAENLARAKICHTGYVRDRDFDYDPPGDTSAPQPIEKGYENVSGWHWCRHEIENYLLEPALVAEATGVEMGEFEDQLRGAAQQLRYYEAARWAVGVGKRSLPPKHSLHTRPASVRKTDIKIPGDLGLDASRSWCVDEGGSFLSEVEQALNQGAIESRYNSYLARFDDAFLEDGDSILLWFSGKDLFSGMETWLGQKSFGKPGDFRRKLRDWCRFNPERVLEILPEWNALVEALQSET